MVQEYRVRSVPTIARAPDRRAFLEVFNGRMSTWKNVDRNGQLRAATYAFSWGQSQSFQFELSERACLVFSPGAALADSMVLKPGTRLLLLAPSAGHVQGLHPWLQRFEDATIFAAQATRARIGSLQTQPLEALKPLLPEHVSIHAPPFCRSGEVWVRADLEDARYWAICDGFTNPSKLTGNPLARAFKRLYRVGPGLEVTRMFAASISDKPRYLRWVRERLPCERPQVVLPCHGEPLFGPDAAQRLIALLQKRLS